MINKLLVFFLGLFALLFVALPPADAQNIGEGCWDNGGSCNRYNSNKSQCSSTAGCTWEEIPSVFGEGGGGCRGTIKQYRNCTCSDFSDDDALCTPTNLPGCSLSEGSCVGTLEKEIFGNPSRLRDLDSPFGMSLPGVTCGDGSAEGIKAGKDACCIPPDSEFSPRIEDPRFFCLPLGGPCASELATKVYDNFFSESAPLKAIEEVSELTQSTGGCVVGNPSSDNPSDPNCRCTPSDLTKACEKYIDDPGEKAKCVDCTQTGLGVWTGLGCIKATAGGFAQSMMGIGVSFAGILALLCIIYSAFLLQTSQGNPERIKKAREYLNSCIIGLILILFAVLILQVIGVNILRIPGFS